jgi:hypothetical protein
MPSTMVLTSVQSGAAVNLTFPVSEFSPSRLGTSWIEMLHEEYKTIPKIEYFNTKTGAILTSAQAGTSPTTYIDLHSPGLTRPLCRPVRRPIVQLPEDEFGPVSPPRPTPYEVLGTTPSWVVLTGPNGFPPLITWHCGSRHPRTLSGTEYEPGTAQLGAGIVTWVSNNTLYAERLDSGRRWHWTRNGVNFINPVHTANAIYAIEECRSPRCGGEQQHPFMITASLAGL